MRTSMRGWTGRRRRSGGADGSQLRGFGRGVPFLNRTGRRFGPESAFPDACTTADERRPTVTAEDTVPLVAAAVPLIGPCKAGCQGARVGAAWCGMARKRCMTQRFGPYKPLRTANRRISRRFRVCSTSDAAGAAVGRAGSVDRAAAPPLTGTRRRHAQATDVIALDLVRMRDELPAAAAAFRRAEQPRVDEAHKAPGARDRQ